MPLFQSSSLLWPRMVNSQQEEEKPQTLSIQEGENVTMNCSYKSTISSLQWYRQDSGRGPVSIILIRTNEREKPSGRLRATLDTANRRSSLSISASQTADTATYFCATDAQFSPGTCSSYTNLSVAAA
uniref:T cell receptor alpha variable 17 n=1 Tax=Oryctolagus cuniculus TaxID=9986 RepID=G1TMX5_RABIT